SARWHGGSRARWSSKMAPRPGRSSTRRATAPSSGPSEQRRMRCPTCDASNPDAARFCGSCGSQLLPRCPRCGAELSGELRFCTGCGAALDDRHGAGAASGAGRFERRLVSVLFVDLEGFSALAEELDPEDVRALQSRYFEVARGVVARYAGTLEKFI